jgi:hypothetical protein
MKSYLWTAALWLAVGGGLLTYTETARADAAKEQEDETRKQQVWDMQIKYASYGCAVLVCAGIVCWVLSNTNQRKKKYIEDLKKQERLDPNEGMPLA